MLNIAKALEHLQISSTVRTQAVQEVRAHLEQAKTSDAARIRAAESLVTEMLGVTPRFIDMDQALTATQYIVADAIASECNVEDGEIALAAALRKADRFRDNPEHKWMYATKEDAVDSSTNQRVVEGLDVKVAVRADGGIKKGGKQVLCDALYEKYVVAPEVKPTNAWFKEMVVRELGMTAAGASTYAYNSDQKFGKLLVKASKGGAKVKAE